MVSGVDVRLWRHRELAALLLRRDTGVSPPARHYEPVPLKGCGSNESRPIAAFGEHAIGDGNVVVNVEAEASAGGEGVAAADRHRDARCRLGLDAHVKVR